ncbi:alpha-amylase family glycosyl hydrolase [Singulisphaera sp. PoT]|uniref:alpha-amylase family glycosyl hydrolase n=1 Tax=Singulisphaera sp. PoT TaxID=3411797 RepID=UPI003BF55219
MGAISHDGGTAFRVWAPHAEKVFVVGSFNDWNETANAMSAEDGGYWYADLEKAKIGDEYRYLIHNGSNKLSRIDPYAKEVTNSVGNGIIHDPEFDWADDDFTMPSWNKLVVYELHIGTFNDDPGGAPGTFADAEKKLGHLKSLGVNAIEIMPAAEFAGDFSWGYNPAHIFAVESSYGGPKAFKHFVKQAHKLGIAVILDVVYNHFGPGDLHIWQFDGWSENNLGGIYFYNDWRCETPWGNSRPDYGRGEVRQYIRDNAIMWVEDFHVDGLRYDMTLYIRQVRADGDPGCDLPDGWGLAQWINGEIRERFPNKITIAEDLQNNSWITKDVGAGGAGFGSQWDAAFVHPVRATVIAPDDSHRNMWTLRNAITHGYNGDAFQRVIYSESHDEVANGKARVTSEVDADSAENYYAKKRSTLAAALVFTSPGIPMLFQGQDFLESGWFQDTVPLDWQLTKKHKGIVGLYRDLISLRLNDAGTTAGLSGQHVNVHHINDLDKMIAFHRWEEGGAGDDVIVVANFSAKSFENYRIGLPQPGKWVLRMNSDWKGYAPDFQDFESFDMEGHPGDYDGYPNYGEFAIAPYSFLIFSQDKE